MLKVVVLVSGGGTNLQAILDAVDSGAITNTEIVGVISNNKNAYALQRAEEREFRMSVSLRKRLHREQSLIRHC